MGIGLELQDENGGVQQSLRDPGDALKKLLYPYLGNESYPMLAYIDPYGDTVFNRPQMKRFLAEWSEVLTKDLTQDERTVAEQVKSLAQHCRDEVHMYLKFIGD